MDSQEKHFALSSPVFNAESSGAAPSLACGSDVLHRRGRHNRSVDDDFGSSDASSIQQTSNGSPFNTKNKLQRLASKTKKATKRLVNAPEQHDKLLDLHQIEDQSRRVLRADAAFNVKQLDTEHRSEKGIAAKVQVNLRAIAKGIAHPKEGIKAKAARSTAGHLAGMERPYLSKNMDIDLLEAHEGLSQAQSAASSARTTSEEEETPEIGSGREKVMQMEVQRESLRAAYTTSRFVQRVRVVPKRHIDFPEAEHFMRRDAQGEHINYDWLLWIGFNLLYYTQDFSAQYVDDFDELPFSINNLRQQVERLAIASAPWQAFFMDIRSVYRWEDPSITAKWLVLYTFLWYTEHLVGFIYGYVIYIVVKNRYFPSSVKLLRESLRRSHDQRSRAYKFGELVDKHGRHHWIEPLLDDLGPYVQLQLNDLANILEVFTNFYAWVYPRKTAATLIFVTVCLLVTLLTDMAFCMKIVAFIIGGAFFICWPIASRYPKYRYLVSPFKWALWDIPTDAEWSFQYLRRNAQSARERLVEETVERICKEEKEGDRASNYQGLMRSIPDITVDGNDFDGDEDWHSASSTISVLDGSDIIAYRAYSQGVVGRLIIYSGGVRFVRSLRRKEMWRREFLELAEMRKKEGSTVSRLPGLSLQSLELKSIDGTKLALEGMKDRDSAFNTIIGFSGLQWQSLQAKTAEGMSDGTVSAL